MQPNFNTPDAATVTAPDDAGKAWMFKGLLDLEANTKAFNKRILLKENEALLTCASVDAMRLRRKDEIECEVPVFGVYGFYIVIDITHDGTGVATVKLQSAG